MAQDWREKLGQVKSWDQEAQDAFFSQFDTLSSGGASKEQAAQQAFDYVRKGVARQRAYTRLVQSGLSDDEAKQQAMGMFQAQEPEYTTSEVIGGLMGSAGGPIYKKLAKASAVLMGATPEAAEQSIERSSRAAQELHPIANIAAGIGGAIARYGALTASGGLAAPAAIAVPSLMATEAALSKPEESTAGLAADVLGLAGAERASEAARAVAEHPLGRAATDALLGIATEAGIGKIGSIRAARQAAAASEAAAAEAAAAREAAAAAAPAQGQVRGLLETPRNVPLGPAIPMQGFEEPLQTQVRGLLPAPRAVEEAVAGPAIPLRGEISPEDISQRLLDAADIAGIEKPKALIDVVEGYSPRTRQQQTAYMRGVKKTSDQLAEAAASLREEAQTIAEGISKREVSARALPSINEAAIQRIESAAAAGRQVASEESGSIITGLRPGFIATPLLVRGGAGALGGAGGALAGSAIGDTPEQRQTNALIGAIMGAGAGLGAPEIASLVRKSGGQVMDDLSTAVRAAQKSGKPLTYLRPDAEGIAAETISPGARQTAGAAAERVKTTSDVPPIAPSVEAIAGQRFSPLLKQIASEDPELYALLSKRVADLASSNKPQTLREWVKQASNLLAVKGEGLLNISPGRMTGPEVLALAGQVKDDAAVLGKVTAIINNPASSIADVEAARAAFDVADARLSKSLGHLLSAKSEQGRALAMNRILANQINSPDYWLLKAQKLAGSNLLSADQRTEIIRLFNQGDFTKLMQYQASLRKSPIWQQLSAIRKALMLSSVPSRVADLVGTAGHALEYFAATGNIGAAIDPLISKAMNTGVRSTTAKKISDFTQSLRGAAEGVADAAESLGIHDLRRGDFAGWSQKIRTVDITPEMAAKYDIPHVTNITASPLLDTMQKAAFRFAGSADRVNWKAAFNAELNNQARVIALNEGLSGKAAAARAAELLKAPTEDMLLDAGNIASHVTFTDNGAIAATINRLYASATPEAKAAADLLAPFRKTPANVMQSVIERTPGLGLYGIYKRTEGLNRALAEAALLGVEKNMSTDVIRAQRALVDALAKQVTGTGAVALGAYLYSRGILTGDLPQSATEREQWRLEGKQPNSILLAGAWYPIGRLSPSGNLMTIFPNISEDKTFSGGLSAITKASLDAPMVTGPAEMALALAGKERDMGAAGTAGASLAKSLVPGIVRDIAHAGSPQRRPTTMTESVESIIPGLQGNVPERVDILGRPSITPVSSAISPFAGRTDIRQQDPLVAEMSRVGARVGAYGGFQIGPRGNRTDLPAEAVAQLQAAVGPLVETAVRRVVESPYYRQLSDQRKRETIERAIKAARTRFTQQVKAANRNLFLEQKPEE